MVITSQCHPMATFSKRQRQLVSAFILEHPEWDVQYDCLTADDLDPGAHPSQTLLVNLPDYFTEGLQAAHGWTVYPTLDDTRIAVVFGDGGPVVAPLEEALNDIGKLRVYAPTERDAEQAEQCCPMFMPSMSPPVPPAPTPIDIRRAA